MKLPKEKLCVHVRRQEQKGKALDKRHPANEGDDHHQRTTRPDVVHENHRQPSDQRDRTEDEDH
jgi:hypothetical protein